MTAVARRSDAEDVVDQTQVFVDLPLWSSTGGSILSVPGTTADPAAFVWRNATIPRPLYGYVNQAATVIFRRAVRPARHAVPNEDLRSEGITHQEFAAWARSMMGGEAPDMLDI